MQTLWSVLVAVSLLGCAGCGRISIGPISLEETALRTDTAPLLVSAGDVLDVATDFGSIVVEIDAQSPPTVEAEVRASGATKAEAEQVLSRFALETVRTGKTVKIRLAGPLPDVEAGGSKSKKSATASFAIKAPPGVEVVAKTGSGSIRIDGPTAKVRAESGFGSVKAKGGRGAIHLKSGSGSVDATDCRGDDMVLESSFGSLTVKDGAGKLTVKTGSGSVTVEGWTGSVEGRSEFGSVRADGVFDRVKVGAGSGGVDVRAGAGSKIENEWSLQSEFGSVKCRLPLDFDAEITAETSFGSVRADHPGLPRESKGSARRYTGALGKGGRPLTLKTGSGSITVSALDG